MSAPRLDSSTKPASAITATGVIKSPNTCWRFMRGTYCPEELCHYQHGPPLKGHRLPRRTAASYGKTACLWFAQGYCKHGDDCNFAHILLDDSRSIDTSNPLITRGETEGGTNDSSNASGQDRGRTSSGPSSKRREPRPPKSAHPLPQDSQWALSSSSERRSTVPYAMMSPGPGSPVVWGIPSELCPEGVEGSYPPEADVPDVDKSRTRQVYDDKKVLVLSGGVMLGRKHGEGERSPSPKPRSLPQPRHRSAVQVPPLHIPPELMVAQSSVGSSASSTHSSGDYLYTPTEWTGGYSNSWSEDEFDPAFSPASTTTTIMGPAPIQWANGYGMQATIPVPTLHELAMKTSLTLHNDPYHRYPQSGTLFHGAPPMTPSQYALPPSAPPDVSDLLNFGALQISTGEGHTMLTTEYSSDEEDDEIPPHRRSSVSVLQHPAVSSLAAQPFRRSSLGAVIELGGKRTPPVVATGSATPVPKRERENGVGHHRNRPSM